MSSSLLALLSGGALLASHVGPEGKRQSPVAVRPPELLPTTHPPIPANLSRLWFVPDASWRPSPGEDGAALRGLAEGARLIAKEQFAQALSLVSAPALAKTALADHATYLRGLAEQGLNRHDQARRAFSSVRARKPIGALLELVTLREAESAEALGDFAGAVALYDTLTVQKPSAPDEVLARLAHAAQGAGDKARAIAAYERLYYEFPLSDQVAEVPTDLGPSDLEPIAPGNARYNAELTRAERLFGARRWAQAREAFGLIQPLSTLDQREMISLRVAACDYYLRRYQAARDALRPFVESAARRAEALFFLLSATHEQGETDEYLRLVRRLVDEFPASSWAEEALNNLGSHRILANEDDKADEVFRELLARFPAGRFASRAGWKVGWWAYRHARYDESARVFEQSAAASPRGDLRPACLYWAAKSRDRLNEPATAVERYRLVVADYANTYYGRLAIGALQSRKAELPRANTASWRMSEAQAVASREPLIQTEHVIRLLIGIGLYDLALDEVQYAERAWGSAPVLIATRAWLLNRRGDLRPGINLMRQAYPQFMTAGGERLPAELLKVIFPIDYWPLIRQYSTAHGLDPYLVAALVGQESTFDPAARSSANAIGMMQIVPATGRRYAAKLGIPGFSVRKLTVPETNIRIGTAYLAELVRRFGGAHFALAGYNAGEYRVARWMAERPDLARDEFIDDIPFPETQNYIKRILGTAEDYRQLYGTPAASVTKAPTAGVNKPARAGRR